MRTRRRASVAAPGVTDSGAAQLTRVPAWRRTRPVEFAVEVLEADERRLVLVADGPISLDVDYLVRPRDEGSELRASVSVRGRGLLGRVIAATTTALLAGCALASSMGRLERELGPAAAH
jgi:hypothetical protein